MIGDREKFDAIFNYENNQQSEASKDRSQNFKKLRNNASSNAQNSLSTSVGEIEGSKYNHNWWANRLDEVAAAEKSEKLMKKGSNNDENSNKFHGKKKFDFEEVSNRRSYAEELNVIFFKQNFLL